MIWRFGLEKKDAVTSWFGTQLLNNQRKKEIENKIALNITYQPSLAQLKNIMTRIHLLLTPDNEHNKVFRDVPMIWFRRAKSLEDIHVRKKILQIKNKGWCGPCKGPTCVHHLL